jgi:P4 family phage/plasmid primase-like protien
MTGPFAKHGRALVQNGYAIIPIPRGRKAPSMEDWQTGYAATERRFDELAYDYANCGVGIVTKHTPAIDIDCLDAEISAKMMQWCIDNLGDAPVRVGKAPKTLLLYGTESPFAKVQSARFYDPSKPDLDPKKKGQRLEVLADGQQFVAYHIHPDTGRPYVWTVEGQEPILVPALDLVVIDEAMARAACREFERLCELAGWERIGGGSSLSASPAQVDEGDALAELDPPEESESEVQRVRSALDAMKPGSSNYDYDEWRNVLFALKWTRWDCAESLAREWSETSDKHVTKTFNVVWRGAQKRDRGREVTLATLYAMAKKAGWDSSRITPVDDESTYDSLMTEIDALEFENNARSAAQKILVSMAKAELTSASEGHLLRAIKGQTGDSIIDLRRDLQAARKKLREAAVEYKQTHAGYAENLRDILTDEAGVTPVACEGMIYVFSPKKRIWVGTLTPDFSVQVAKNFDGMPNCERRSDYKAIAEHLYSAMVVRSEGFFDNAPTGLACNGKFYTINERGEIDREELTADHRQRMLAPHRPKVGDMPLFTQFLKETFEGDKDNEQIDALQEVFGAALLRTMWKFQKVAMFYGPGRSGKGTVLRILSAMFPREMRAAVSPMKMDNEYYIADTSAKALNVVGELPDDQPIPAAAFKSVTGGDVLTGRHPSHRPFTFVCQAAHIFNSNHFIYTKDHSEAFYTRFIMFHFRNSRIGRDDIDADLADRIIENEMPAILAWALQGARRLHDRGRFKLTSAHHNLMRMWRHRSSSMLEFLLDTDECEIGAGFSVRRAALYAEYSRWCKESNRRPVGKQKCYEEFSSKPYLELGLSMGFDRDGANIVRGIRTRDSFWETQDSESDENDSDL